MRVLTFYNPASGAGRAFSLARELAERCSRRGVEMVLQETAREYDAGALSELLSSAEAVVVSGGDGSLMPLLVPLTKARRPVLMLPAGNESLFARAFEMPRSVDAAANALCSMTTRDVYVGLADGSGFFCMVSAGLDSQVIARIARTRTGPIGKAGYVVPTVAALAAFRPPSVTIVCDGVETISGQPGYLVVAKSAEYAGGLRPVPEARSEEPVLWARFFPGFSRRSYLRALLAYATGTSVDREGSRIVRAKRINVELEPRGYPIQADGELIGFGTATLEVHELPLSVVVPPRASIKS